jgi:branched-chain amino acid transport system ATP-binding protein
LKWQRRGPSRSLKNPVIETILRLRDQGLTILLVEQNVGVAAAVAGTAYVLKDGEIAYTGDAPELINDAKVLASYLGG